MSGKELIPIMKTNDEPSELDNYFHFACCVLGLMNVFANSIELRIDIILEKNSVKISPRTTLGRKIERVHDYKAVSDELYAKLKTFNCIWNICKHGIPIATPECASKPIECPIIFNEIALWKDGNIHHFNNTKRESIESDCSYIMRQLDAILKGVTT